MALKEEVEKADWSPKTCGNLSEARQVVEDDEEDVDVEFGKAQGDYLGLFQYQCTPLLAKVCD